MYLTFLRFRRFIHRNGRGRLNDDKDKLLLSEIPESLISLFYTCFNPCHSKSIVKQMLQLIYTIFIDIGSGYFRRGAVTLRGAATFGFRSHCLKKQLLSRGRLLSGGGYFRDSRVNTAIY